MEISVKVCYKGFCQELDSPCDPDMYSALDLVDDCIRLLKNKCKFPLPAYPIFCYKHPKSKRHIEIGCDRQLLLMFELLEGRSSVDIIVKEGGKETELLSTYKKWLKDEGKRNVGSDGIAVATAEAEVICPNSPPQTQPSQDNLHTKPPEITPPLHVHLPTPNPVPEHLTSVDTGNEESPDGRRDKKKKKPRGLNLRQVTSVNDSSVAATHNQPQSQPEEPIGSFTATLLPSPGVQSQIVSVNDNSVAATRISVNSGLAIVPRPPSGDELSSKTIGREIVSEFDDDRMEADPAYYSDDSWQYHDEEHRDISSDDNCESDPEIEVVDELDGLDDVDKLDNIKDSGQFSGDEDEGLVADEKYLKNGVHFELQPDGSINLEPKQMFINKNAFLEVMHDYAVQEGIDYHRVANDPWKYTVLCNNLDSCTWRLHASRLADNVTFMIKTIKGEHSCVRLSENPCATSAWIRRKIMSDLRANKALNPSSIKNLLREKYGVSSSYMKCFRARREAMKLIEGNHAESYSRLHQYSKIALERNPGSIIDLKYQEYLNGPPTFSRIFVCFNALKEGFLRGCRPFLGVDGCHLKGPYGGVLLSAVSIDGNNGIFPVAFAVVASETTATWSYFFSNLKLIASEEVRRHWVIISDRQKGVEPALAAVLPEVTRRICCRHLYANYKKDHPGALLRNLFWEAAQCYTEPAFRDVLKRIEETSSRAFRYLRDVDYTMWVRYHMPKEIKVIETTSNFVESFNSKLSTVRGSPILSLLEDLRRDLMKKINGRREAINQMSGTITPYAMKKLNNNTKAGRRCAFTASSDYEYEVTEPNMHFIVNLRDRHCDCMVWDFSGIPCKHACAVLNHKRIGKEQFVDQYFSMLKYADTYCKAISPIPDPNIWPDPVGFKSLSPPFLKKLPGRPKKNRRREDGEAQPTGGRSSHVKCGQCKQMGHNSRTCKSQKNRGVGQGEGLVVGSEGGSGNGAATRTHPNSSQDKKRKKDARASTCVKKQKKTAPAAPKTSSLVDSNSGNGQK